MRINIISFHGLYSQGYNLEILVGNLARALQKKGHNIRTVQYDYPKLNVSMGYFQWSRDIVRDYMLRCLQLEYKDNPAYYTIVVTHSNATWAGSRLIGKYFNEPLRHSIRIDRFVMFGSTVKRNFDWGRYLRLKVINFVGTRDRVVWLSKLFRMGWSGRKGFKIKSLNLTEVFRPWRHSDFVLPENFETIRNEVLKGLEDLK